MNNRTGEDTYGLRFRASFNPDFSAEYAAFIQDPAAIRVIPLGVPVVNPARAALGLADTIVRCQLLPSKRAFPLPPKMRARATLAQLVI